MARRNTIAPDPTDGGGERLRARMVSKLAPLAPPWVMLGATCAVGAVSHQVWGGPAEVTWAAVAASVGTSGLTGLTWAITHARRTLGRVHATMTTAVTGGWLTVATVTGLGPDMVTGALWWGGGALALSWNLRTVIRHFDPDQGTGGDALGALFDRAKEQAGLPGARARARQVTDRKIKGVLSLPPGQATVADAQRAIGRLESGMRVPPGTIALAADPDRADLAELTISDPRVLRSPIPWEGPSRPGGSIADAIRVGVWQDGDDCEFSLPGSHLQVMGRTGSGKSIGGAWNILAEVMTRTDATVLAIDTSKDDQTLGPLRPGLGAFVTEQSAAVQLLRRVHAAIPERTRWLAQHGHSKWNQGCGLTYWVLWIEEASKFMASLSTKDEERLEETVKEARSAGITIVLSLQRSDYTQMPTLLRGQLAKMCFGLSSAEDAKWGLSTRQQKVDTVEPEAWEANYPGMAYLDAPGVTEKHAVMPLRTFDWGTDGRATMTAHATTHTTNTTTVDPFTATLLASTTATPGGASSTGVPADGPDSDESDGDGGDGVDVVRDVLDEAAAMDPELADPDPAVTGSIRPDTPIQAPSPEEAEALETEQPHRLSPAEAREELHRWIARQAATGRSTFRATDDDLADLRHSVGMSRSWTYKVLRELLDTGHLTVDDGTYTITNPDHDPARQPAYSAA